MAWPTRTTGQTLSGDGAKTLGLDLWDRDAIAAESSWTWPFNEQNFSADTSYALQASAFFRLPEWAEATAVITLTILAKQSGGSDNADFRMRGRVYSGSFTTGSATSDALTGSYAPYEVTLAVPASPSWKGEVVELELQAQHTTGGGTWNLTMEFLMANIRVKPISP